jgi:hypothetical protein
MYLSVDLPDRSGHPNVFDWENGPMNDENLVCLDTDGRVRWRAKLPTSEPGDCFVTVTLDGDLVRASSMSYYAVWIDPVTGEMLRSNFTK